MDDGTKKFNKKLIRGTDDKIVFIPTHKNNNSTSNGFWAPLWNILMTRAKKQ